MNQASDNQPLILKAEAKDLSFYYGNFKALKNINMPIYEKRVTSLIGPSGCGKSTYLRSFNRMHDLYPGNRYEGEIRFFPDNTNLLSPGLALRYAFPANHSTEPPGDVILGFLALWLDEDLIGHAKFNHFTDIHVGREIGDPGCLLHVVGDDQDGHLFP